MLLRRKYTIVWETTDLGEQQPRGTRGHLQGPRPPVSACDNIVWQSHRMISESTRHKSVLPFIYCPIEVQILVDLSSEASRAEAMMGPSSSDSSCAPQETTNPSDESNGGCACCVRRPQTGGSPANTVAPDATTEQATPLLCASETSCCSHPAEQTEAQSTSIPDDQPCCTNEDRAQCQSGIPSQSDRCQAGCCAGEVSPSLCTTSSCCGRQESDRSAGDTGQDYWGKEETDFIRSDCCERIDCDAEPGAESCCGEKGKEKPILARCSQNTSCEGKEGPAILKPSSDKGCCSDTSKIQASGTEALETCCRESSECECSGTYPLSLYSGLY